MHKQKGKLNLPNKDSSYFFFFALNNKVGAKILKQQIGVANSTVSLSSSLAVMLIVNYLLASNIIRAMELLMSRNQYFFYIFYLEMDGFNENQFNCNFRCLISSPMKFFNGKAKDKTPGNFLLSSVF